MRTENYRMHALDAQRRFASFYVRDSVANSSYRGNPVFTSLSDQPSNYLELNKDGLDWDRIAEKVGWKYDNSKYVLTYLYQVSASSIYTRKPRECEIRWLGDLHPDFNHGPWTQDETAKLKELISEHGSEQLDWEAIADKLGVRLLLQLTEK